MLKIFFFFLFCICSLLASAPWLNEDKPNSTLTEGDIALEDAQDSNEQRSAIEDYQLHASATSPRNRKWVNNIVPFILTRGFNPEQRKTILAAMIEIHQKTCISFVGRDEQKDFILFRKVPDRSLCSSLLGREGGRQHVNLTDECVERNTVLHELMHVLGFQHEHSRHDRDKNIQINLSIVKREYKQHLQLIRKVDPMDSLVRYDHKSITHYPEDAFSAYINRKTIISRLRAVKVKSDGLSEMDVWKIKYNYCVNEGENVDGSNEHAEATTNVRNIITTTVDQQTTYQDETNTIHTTTSQLSTTQSTIKQVQTTSSRTITETSIGKTLKKTTSSTTRPVSILNKEIIKAVKEGNETKVQTLLNGGADVNAKDNMDWTPLHYAARYGLVNVVSLLLDKRANIEATTTSNWTPLHWAALHGHVNVVSLLLDKRTNIEARTTSNWTALHLAALHGHVNVVSLLLDKGANIFAKVHLNYVDSTPLDLAKLLNKPEIVKILERKQVQTTSSTTITETSIGKTLKKTTSSTTRPVSILNKEIIKAVKEGNETKVQTLLNGGADVNAKDNIDWTPLHYAARYGLVNVVSLLLDKRANIEARTTSNWTPLHWAALHGHVNVVSLLLEKRANIEARTTSNWTALHWAALHGHVNVVSLLLDKGANIFAKVHLNYVDSTPLDLAKLLNKPEIVKILERKQVQTTSSTTITETSIGKTLKKTTSSTTRPVSILYKEIIKAVKEGNETKVQTLLNGGADVNAKDNMDWTTLHYAARYGLVNVVSLLLDKRANIEARTTSNWTPLHWAALHGHVNVVSLLLDKRTNIEARTTSNWTALHLAALHGHVNVVSLLLDKGANIFAKVHLNYVDSTLLDLAKLLNKPEIVKILERKQRQLIIE